MRWFMDIYGDEFYRFIKNEFPHHFTATRSAKIPTATYRKVLEKFLSDKGRLVHLLGEDNHPFLFIDEKEVIFLKLKYE